MVAGVVMKRVATSPDGISLAFDDGGAGDPAIVFVHGWSCDRTYWAAQMPAFTDRHRVVAIDLAGHGESGTGRRAWTMPAFGDDVAAVVDQLGIEDVVLVGHSMGGDVIVEAALLLRDRVRGLVWVDTYRSLAEPITIEELREFLAPFQMDFAEEAERLVRGFFLPTSDPALVERVVAGMSGAPPEVALDALEHAIANEGPAVAGLGRLSVPIVAINPDYRPTDVASLRRHGVRTVIVAGVGHFPMMEDPEQFNRRLAEVVESFAR